MKKLLLIAAALTTTASAASTSANITINASVAKACKFETNQVDIEMNYSPLDADDNVMNAGAVLHCNPGHTPNVRYAPGATTLSNGLKISYVMTTEEGGAAGVYMGANKTAYNLKITAAKNQWGASSASATTTYSINVEF